MKRRLLVLLFVLYGFSMQAQIFAGLNAGPLTGMSLEGFVMAMPKNQDWLHLSVGGGYNLKGPNFLRLFPKDNLDALRHSGYWFFASIRNELTDDHHAPHLWWGIKLTGTHLTESARSPSGPAGGSQWVAGMGVMAGYSMILNKKTTEKNIYLDFGLQPGFRLWENGSFLMSKLNYIPGLGYGRTGTERGFNLDLIVILRYELKHGRYGYWKAKLK